MKKRKWPTFSDIFAFQPPIDNSDFSSWESSSLSQITNNDSEEESSDLFQTAQQNSYKETWNKIRFDNTIRLLISIPTYIASVAMWMGGAIPSLLPMTVIFGSFGFCQFCITWLFMNKSFARRLDFLMSTCDLLAMSFAIYCTGGANSPLYFIYFIPLLVHAFHRDWALVLFNGLGGSVFYTSAILNSLDDYSLANLTNLGTRLFFMFLTLGIVYFAVHLLRTKDRTDKIRLNRLRMLAFVGRKLNTITALSELPNVIKDVTRWVNDGMGSKLNTWTRFLLIQEDPAILRSLEDLTQKSAEFKQEISAHLCPVMKTNNAFEMKSKNSSPDCPIETFSFGSHLCLPVRGTDNESYGVLFCGSPVPHAFADNEKQFLSYISRSLALAIQRLERIDELKKAVEMNSCVMAAYIGSSRSLGDTYKAVLEGTATILEAERVSLMVWDSKDELLKTVDVYGPKTQHELNIVQRMGEGAAGRTLENKEPFWTTELNEERGKAMICLPLLTLKGAPLGVLMATRLEKWRGFSPTEIENASTFAARASLAIENALLHQREKQEGLPAKQSEAA